MKVHQQVMEQKNSMQKPMFLIIILLVVNMMLTGFDAKPLNTLYLDKNLVWHTLVQAYSRTNRVDKVTKQFGQIVTYRNIKKWQDDALRLFSGDGDPNEYLLESYEDTYYPEKMIDAGKAAYVERNYEMIDTSSYCICYYDENYAPPRRKNSRRDLFDYQPKSGTRMAFDYANKRNLMIYNVFE